jgi:hypothetical protein
MMVTLAISQNSPLKKNIGLGKEKKKTHWWRTLISNTVRKERKKSAPNYEASHEVGPVIFPFFCLFFFFFFGSTTTDVTLQALGNPKLSSLAKPGISPADHWI